MNGLTTRTIFEIDDDFITTDLQEFRNEFRRLERSNYPFEVHISDENGCFWIGINQDTDEALRTELESIYFKPIKPKTIWQRIKSFYQLIKNKVNGK